MNKFLNFWLDKVIFPICVFILSFFTIGISLGIVLITFEIIGAVLFR